MRKQNENQLQTAETVTVCEICFTYPKRVKYIARAVIIYGRGCQLCLCKLYENMLLNVKLL